VWKISSGSNFLFLGGSVHLLRENDFPLPKEFDLAFTQSSVLVLEADIEQVTNEKGLQYLASKIYLPQGKTLQSILDPDTYLLLKQECENYELSIDSFYNYKPSMVIYILNVLQIEKFGTTEQGVDVFLQNRAKEENKPIDFLETAEFQIDEIVGMGEGYENDYVLYSLQDLSSTDDDVLAEMITEWKTGNMAITETALAELKKDWPKIYKSTISDRNATWIPQIEKYLALEQVSFFVVGAAHLHGPDGLLVQLKNSGYTVEQLK
jgi:uncharacterized protein YbaP (TraB family)